jgi:hypothetical protein
MRLSPRLLSLVAGSAAVSAVGLSAIGCGGTQTLARAEEPRPAPGPAVQVAITTTPRRTPNNVNEPPTPEQPGVTTVSQPAQTLELPEDVPVDCGRG